MAALARLLRIVLAAVFCIILFSALFEFLNALLYYIFPPEGVNDIDNFRRQTPLLGALWWGVVFRSPGYVYFGTIPLLLIFSGLEWSSVRSRWAYLAIWTGAGLLAAGSPFSSFSQSLAALLAGGLTGYAYWFLAGHTAGRWRRDRELRERETTFPFASFAAYAVLAYLAYQVAGYLYYGGKLFWVSYVSEPERGVPPYSVARERLLTAAHKVALRDFPDPQSCLEDGEESLSPEKLQRMDWDRINNTAEAEVCTFRLLGSYDGLSHASQWLEAQGFRVPESFSSASPQVMFDGNLRVLGYHSIRENGPKFPTHGFIKRAFRSIPYSMHVGTIWSDGGERLLGVEIGFSTL